MKLSIFLLISASLALGQTPAPSKTGAAAKKAGAPAAKKSAPAAKKSAPAASSTARLMNPAALNAKAPEVYRVRFTTTKGDFVIEVNRAWAPLGADRFYNLVRNHFYDNASLFRVVPGFVVQWGIPANAAVAKAWANANIKDEPVKQSNKRGTITYAKSSLPNSRSTQVFINLGDNSRLDADGFAAFGTVTEGMDVIANLYSGYRDAPTERQDEMTSQGRAFVDKNFPNLDSIKSTTIIFPETTAAPAKKAAPSASKASPTATKAPATKAPATPAPKK
jgi:peptidyl-prolyl cis-trans isomerase A (cyclophilin A)